MNALTSVEDVIQTELLQATLMGDQPSVRVEASHYLVDLSPRAEPRFHRVGKDKTCSCGDVHCPAIDAVRSYLLDGGPRAPDPPGEVRCPICGSTTTPDSDWDGRYTREPGWRCNSGGLMHFLLAKANRIKGNVARNPYLIPPAPGYPGLLRTELVTSTPDLPGPGKVPDYSI